MLLYAGGNLGALLGSLNTIVGLVLFGALWLTTWWCTRRAWRAMGWTINEPIKYGRLYSLGARWGGVNGILFLFALLTIQIITVFIFAFSNSRFSDVGLGALRGFVFVGFCGTPFAFVIGAVFGFVFAAIDALLIDVTNLIFHMSENDIVNVNH